MNSNLLKILFYLLVLKYYLVLGSDETEGIDILHVNSSIACSEEQPLIVEENYGYITTPNFDGFHFYPSNITCSWLLIAKPNHSFVIKFKDFELDSIHRDGLYLYDGYNRSALLIQTFLGSRRDLLDFRAPGKVLFMSFVGLPNPKTLGFYLYFEQKPVPVHCNSNQIACRNGYKCAELEQYCNGVDDCEDGTDEQKCPINSNDLKFKNSCGKPQIKPIDNTMRIVGGIAAKPGSWPWMVDMRAPNNEPNGHLCGATVLNREWILTAAHCFNDLKKPNDWRIHFGKYQKLVHNSNELIRYIENIYIHPDYRGDQSLPDNTSWFERNSNDMALVKLNSPLPLDNPFISSVCLPELNEELKPNDMVWVTGWGDTYWTGNELVLKQVKVPIISNELCHQWMPYYNVGESMICAGYEEGGQDSCQGDSGGPLVRMNPKTQNFKILGIVSTGGLCGGQKQAGIYTKVSHFVSWIENTISEQKLFELKLLDTLMTEWKRFRKIK